jgi:hypothetical protein
MLASKGGCGHLRAKEIKEINSTMKKLFAVLTLAAFTLTCPAFAQEKKEEPKKEQTKKPKKTKKTDETKKAEEKK